ncbi:MAG TPA: methyltransferase domain-containing protein [Acidimicrobiales bacterium]|nr:methyltransferase domain-containing protein [Acidimicrobiales bacterium]
MDLPRQFVIRESTHRIHNPLTPAKLARLGEALLLRPGQRVLDLACGSGELLCTWARDHGISGIGVDVSSAFIDQARARAAELGAADRVHFEHADASGYVAAEPVDIASCLGATWIGNGMFGTIDLLGRSLRAGGLILIGEPYWVRVPATDDVARACHARDREEWCPLPELIASLLGGGLDLVQMLLAGPDDWDAYHGLQWLNLRRWLDANPGDELWSQMRAELDRAPTDHLVTREHLGWGVFALMAR